MIKGNRFMTDSFFPGALGTAHSPVPDRLYYVEQLTCQPGYPRYWPKMACRDLFDDHRVTPGEQARVPFS
jgi:hypothetical protein